MKSCDIHIQKIEVPDSYDYDCGFHINLQMKEADVADKFLVLYSLANSMKLTKTDLMLFAMAAAEGVFDNRMEIALPGGFVDES